VPVGRGENYRTTMRNPKVCVIISMYGLNELTKNCIDHLISNAGIEHDILIVDDGSPIPFEDPRVNVLRLDKNCGWTKANNEGILWCGNKYDYVWILNNDTEPQKDSLKMLVTVMDDDPRIGITSPVRLDYRDGEFLCKEYFPVDMIDGIFATSVTGKQFENSMIDVAWQPGVALLISMKAQKYVGLFDERMRQYSSDNDYCVRMEQMGYRVVLVTSSEVKHYIGSTCKCSGTDDDKQVLLKKRML
jgi:rhamnopyranosyl-N-acetylglucosaminyl-diphospho-decaprenol beta-1,3/1,4-galactofuranosyltransferase